MPKHEPSDWWHDIKDLDQAMNELLADLDNESLIEHRQPFAATIIREFIKRAKVDLRD